MVFSYFEADICSNSLHLLTIAIVVILIFVIVYSMKTIIVVVIRHVFLKEREGRNIPSIRFGSQYRKESLTTKEIIIFFHKLLQSISLIFRK